MKNNKGVTYVELVLVISIMAIMVGFVSITMSTVNRNNATKAAHRMQTALAQAKSVSMAKGTNNGQLMLWRDSSGSLMYYVGQVGTNPADPANVAKREAGAQLICNRKVTVQTGVGATGISNTVAAPYIISFNQSSGAFESTGYIDYIYFSNGNTRAHVQLFKATGKTEVGVD